DRQPDPLFETLRQHAMYSTAKPASERASPPRDDYERLLHFSSSLTLENNDPKSVELAIGSLPEECKVHLQTHLPQDKFETVHLWILALQKEVHGVLLPRARFRERRFDPDDPPVAADLLAPEKMLEDLVIEERLEAQIDRALRRLFWLKTQKKLDR